MSLTIKLILPLCKKVIPKEFLTKEAGFVDAYTIDPEWMQCNSHITLLYDFIIDNAQKARRLECFRRNGLVHQKRIINGKWYLVYHIKAYTNSINHYRSRGRSPYAKSDILKIVKYWNTEDDDINNVMFNIGKNVEWKDTFLPESDFNEKDHFSGITIRRKPEDVD